MLIIACINYSDLPSLCRVNSTFYELGSNRLYRNIRHPDALRVLHIALSPSSRSQSTAFRHPTLYFRTPTMLVHSIRRRKSIESHDRSPILACCRFRCAVMVLRNCSFRVITFSFAAQRDADLVLGSHSPYPALKPTALPKLAKVKARASWLSILVPGRPVRDVIFNDTSHCAVIDVKFLSRSIAPIQRLSIVAENVYTLPVSQLVAIVPHLHVLVVNCSFIGSQDTWVGFFTFSLSTLDGDICSSEPLGLSLSGWLPLFRFFWSFAISL